MLLTRRTIAVIKIPLDPEDSSLRIRNFLSQKGILDLSPEPLDNNLAVFLVVAPCLDGGQSGLQEDLPIGKNPRNPKAPDAKEQHGPIQTSYFSYWRLFLSEFLGHRRLQILPSIRPVFTAFHPGQIYDPNFKILILILIYKSDYNFKS